MGKIFMVISILLAVNLNFIRSNFKRGYFNVNNIFRGNFNRSNFNEVIPM